MKENQGTLKKMEEEKCFWEIRQVYWPLGTGKIPKIKERKNNAIFSPAFLKNFLNTCCF